MPNYDWNAWESRMAGRADPLDAAIAMERAGLLTARAAGIIARFSVLSDTVVSCGYHRATGKGWVTYCGATYTPTAFNTLVAEETGGNASASGEALDDLDDDEPPPPAASPTSIATSATPSVPFLPSVRLTWVERLHAAWELVSALTLFAGALLVTVTCVGWVVVQGLGQLVTLLIGGLLDCFTALIGR